MANLESAAMLALQSGVDPYSSKSYLDWMSSVPEAQKQLPGAIKRQRERQVSELESGIPEKIRTAAQPLARRGLHGSGLQLEDIGQAALDRQIAIDRAKTLAEIDPIQAQIALQDLGRERAVERGKEERRRFEREEDVTERQRAQDQLMKAALAKAGIGILAGTNPLSSAIFGGKGQEGLLQKAIGGIGSLFGGGDTSMVTPEMMQYGRYGDIVDEEEQGLLAPGQTMTPPPLFGTGMIRKDMENVYGTGTGTNVPMTNFGNITAYEGETQVPMIPEQPVGEEDYITPPYQYPSPSEKPLGDMGMMTMGGTPQYDTSPFGTGMDAASMQMPQDYYDQTPTDKYLLEGYTAGMRTGEGGTTYGDGPMDYMLTPKEFPKMFGVTPAPTSSTGFETEVTPFLNRTLNPDVYDVDFDNFLGQDLYEEDYFDFSKASGTPSTDASEAMRKAMEKGFKSAEGRTFKNPLDDPNLTAMLGTDALMKNTPVTEGETDILGTLGSVAKLPFQALGAGMKAVGGAKKAVGDLTTKALDAATGGAYSGIRGLGGQATKAVSDALGGVVSPSTVGSLALTALRGTGGLKSVAKDPLGFAGKKILSSSLPSLKSTVGALSKGSLPSMASTPFGASQLAANAAYDAALAQGLSVQAADKAALAASNTAMTPLGASVVGIPMLAMSIGQQQAKKSRAKEAIEYTRNLAGSAPHNLIPGELWMAGNRRTSPVLEESNTNFRITDQLTGMDKIFLEDPRRSVMGGDSLSKRGKDFAKENNINYKHSDPDVQNMSQKWLGKQQVYSELIPELRPIFEAGLKGEIPRQQAEDAIADVSNRFFKANPVISQIYNLNQRISQMEEANKSEGDSFVEDQIMALKEQGNLLKKEVPLAWRNVTGLMPEVFEVEFIEDEQE